MKLFLVTLAAVALSSVAALQDAEVNPYQKSAYMAKLKASISQNARSGEQLWSSDDQFLHLHAEPTAEAAAVQPQSGVDWRTSNLLRPVENQGSCGSCWAFSSTHAFNDRVSVDKRQVEGPPFYSMQNIVECCRYEGCGGCDGGFEHVAYRYMKEYGITSIDCKAYNDRPYRCSASRCDDGSAVRNLFHAKDYVTIKTLFGSHVSKMEAALAVGPITVSLQVWDDFMNYRSGIYAKGYKGRAGSYNGGHAVESVGYGSSTADYWIIKNSWGPGWGQRGFIYIRKGVNEVDVEKWEEGYAVTQGLEDEEQWMFAGFSGGRIGSLDVDAHNSDDDNKDDDNKDAPHRGGNSDVLDLNDEALVEAAKFAAFEVNPASCEGKTELVRILAAQKQAVAGVNFWITMLVGGEGCPAPVAYSVQVHRDIDEDHTYHMLQSMRVALPAADLNDATPAPAQDKILGVQWKVAAMGATGLAGVLLIALIAACHRVRAAKKQNYQQLVFSEQMLVN